MTKRLRDTKRLQPEEEKKERERNFLLLNASVHCIYMPSSTHGFQRDTTHPYQPNEIGVRYAMRGSIGKGSDDAFPIEGET